MKKPMGESFRKVRSVISILARQHYLRKKRKKDWRGQKKKNELGKEALNPV